MGLGLQNSLGFAQAASKLRELIAEREKRRMAAEALQYERGQDTELLGLRRRAADADDVRAQATLADSLFRLQPKPPTISVVRGLRGKDGPQVGAINEQTGEELWRKDAYDEPGSPGTAEQQYIRGESARLGRTLTPEELLSIHRRFAPPTTFVVPGPTGPIYGDRRAPGAGAKPLEFAGDADPNAPGDQRTPVGKPLPETAREGFNAIEASIQALEKLRANVEKRDSMGPADQLKVLWPWSDVVKFQAGLAIMKQEIGKAKEGGVLRLEDEKKYDKMLTAIGDPRSLSLAKIDEMLDSMERNLEVARSGFAQGGMQYQRINPGRPQLRDGQYWLKLGDKEYPFETPGAALEAARRVRAAQGGGR